MSMVWLIVPAFITALIVIRRPLWGVFLVFLLSPLKTFGSDILLIARLAGLFTVAVTFLSLVNQRRKIRWTGIEAPVIVMGVGMGLSFFHTTNIEAVFDALFSLLSLYGLVLVIYNLIENEGQLRSLMMVFLFSGIIPVYQAFVQRTQGPSYIGQQFVRVSGTFTLATGLGGFLIPYTLVATALLFYPGFSRLQRLFLIGMFSASYTALIFTVSRGALAATFIGFGLLFFLLRSTPKDKQKISPLIFFLVAVIVFLITNQLWASIQGRLVSPLSRFVATGTSDENVQARDDEFRLLVKITLDNNFMGTGIGNYANKAIRYRYIYNAPALPLDPHNILLYLFGEVGIVMVVGFFWLVGSIFRRMYSSYTMMKEKPQSIVFYVYISSFAAIVGYSVFMITHSGLFTNELWFSLAFLLVAIWLAGNTEYQASEKPSYIARRRR